MANKDVAKSLMAVRMMSGVTLWFEASLIEKLRAVLNGPRAAWPAFVQVSGEMINPSSIEGIYTPGAMEAESRIKRGEWQCTKGTWHDRREKCECTDEAVLKKRCLAAIEYHRAHGYYPLNAPSFSDIKKYLAV